MDLEPIPRPRTKRAMNKLTHELARPSQIDATDDQMSSRKVWGLPPATKQERKMTPLRPMREFNGSVSQQPRTAQARYGAELTRPVSQEASDSERYGG